MRNARRIAVLALVLSLSAASSAGAYSLNDADRIQALRSSWEDSVNFSDLQGLLSLYADGAVLLPVGGAPVLGRESIAGWHARWYAGADVHYELDAGELRLDGLLASENWAAVVTLTPRTDRDTGIGCDPMQFTQRGVRVYRKDPDGEWRIDRETWSTVPLAAIGLLETPAMDSAPRRP
jgi:uncharacterized protein (TIGR02246 family)